jgi:hypothetical protein
MRRVNIAFHEGYRQGVLHILDDVADRPWALRTLSSTWPTCSLTYCCVLAAHGVNEALREPCQHVLRCTCRPEEEQPRDKQRQNVRDALPKSRDLSKILHDDVFETV